MHSSDAITGKCQEGTQNPKRKLPENLQNSGTRPPLRSRADLFEKGNDKKPPEPNTSTPDIWNMQSP
jgi:hypothetical protein